MSKVKSLSADRLRAALPPSRIPYADSTRIPERRVAPPQPRALQALELAVAIRDSGYNVYVSGEPNLGRMYMVRNFLAPRAAKAATPPDVLYVYNFKDPDRPMVLRLPAGEGRRLRRDLAAAVAALREEIPVRFENEAFLKKRQELMEGFDTAREKVFQAMEEEASGQGFNLDMDDQGAMTLYPLVEGKLLSEDEFERLPADLRKRLKLRGDKLMQVMAGLIRQINKEEKGLRARQRDLDREVVGEVLAEHFDPLSRRFAKRCRSKELSCYFRRMRECVLENIEQFSAREGGHGGEAAQAAQAAALLQGAAPDDFFVRFEVNLFVDNSRVKGAPIVVEDHPTVSNLLGCIEREAEMGALFTDLTLIKSGALHRANGGYLLMHIEDILSIPAAWEGLMRALRAGQARIEEAGEGQDQTRTKGIEPEPVPLDVKVILIGTDDVYETLLTHEDRFPKLFKIKAHLRATVERNAASVRAYLGTLRSVIDDLGLLPFDRGALARVVDYASRLAEDQRKLSLMVPLVRELMIEASAMAGLKRRRVVDAEVLDAALSARIYRSNLYEEEFMEEYDRRIIKVQTTGTAVGRVNGLSVTWFGDYEFGLPHQIACTVGVGHGGVIDLEREAELGGPIHTKAMMILKSYLLSQFAQDKPLVFTGSLCFEQSYAHIEGDSASGAELAALLSALAGAPIDLSLAFTGAVSQSGGIMAVGGVTPKIEGFFQVCRRHGLTGRQGVLVPADTVDQLMLGDEVVEAVAARRFHIYPVKTIEEALEMLTGRRAGRRTASGGFTRGTLYHAVDARLAELAELAEPSDK